MQRWRSFLAIGDSFTEGIGDEPWPDGTERGWADRAATALAAAAGPPGFRYANLGIRGKQLGGIVDGQLPLALEMGAELVTYCGGGNDVLRPGCRVDELGALFAGGLRRLVDTGADVVVFTGFYPRGLPLQRRLRGLIAAYNELLRSAAAEHGCPVVDLWEMRVLDDPRAWCADRLHLSPAGHELVALHFLEVLGMPVPRDWRAPWPVAAPRPWPARRFDDLRWTREHLVPWLHRQARGRSTGDGRIPKRPMLTLLAPAAAQASPTDA